MCHPVGPGSSRPGRLEIVPHEPEMDRMVPFVAEGGRTGWCRWKTRGPCSTIVKNFTMATAELEACGTSQVGCSPSPSWREEKKGRGNKKRRKSGKKADRGLKEDAQGVRWPRLSRTHRGLPATRHGGQPDYDPHAADEAQRG